MSGNPWAGEVSLRLNGEVLQARLTLGALAELEADLGEDSLMNLVERFENARFSTRDVLSLVVAGLRGGGWRGSAADLLSGEIAGGPIEAARVAGALLARAFALPQERDGAL
ncbi:gene transfer agent family protein [Oceaniglobus trochenteri]|uniref:gene transfer agent family protein n=1 Tax=Oceaniglobus trochenteri TaxID=2763260 RepID=UPI001CFF9951|nr:gene transfer agent family protein [Oceaniglobus trochenteri]